MSIASDPTTERLIASPESATVYHRGQTAEAEPAVPGWTFAVDELFD